MNNILEKISTQILRIIPFILSLVVPLFFLPFTADYFTFNKYYFVAIVGTISLIAWCVRNLTRGKLHFTSSPASLPLVILVLANIVSSVWLSQTKYVSLFGQTSLFFFLAIIFLTVTSSQKNRFVIASSIYGLIISSSLLSLYALLNKFNLLPQAVRSLNPAGGILPALSFTLPILVATTVFTIGVKNWFLKSALFASVLLMIAGTVINISLLLPQNGVPAIAILPTRAGWSATVDTFKSWPTALLGTGPETYFSTFTRLRPAYLNLDNNFWNIRFSESSNFFFTLITTTGLIGALAFLLAFLRPLLLSIKAKGNSFLVVALSLTTLSFLVIPIGVVSLVLGIVLLIGLTIQQKLEDTKGVKDVAISLATETSSSPILPWIMILLSLAILGAYWFFSGKVYLGSMAFKQAADISQTDAYGSYLKLQKAATVDTTNPYYPQRLSQLYLSVAKTYLSKEKPTDTEKQSGTDFAQRAIDAGKISARLDPANVTTWENLFTVYSTLIPYAQGSADLAISHGLQAASLDPTNPAIYLQLGVLFYNLGDVDQAVKFIDRASELKRNWNLPYLNLASIYKVKKEYPKALQYAQAGLQYTDSKSTTDLATVQAEVKALEELVPTPAPAATTSATAQ